MHEASIKTTPDGKKSKKVLILSIVLVITLIATGALSYLYVQQKDTTSNLQKELDAKNKKTVEKAAQSNDSDTKNTQYTNYTAKIGKFTLQLPEKYTIVQKLDGGGEGGEATVITLAQKVNKNTDIVSTNYLVPTEIKAIRNLNNESLESYIEAYRDGLLQGATEENVISIDGVTARVFNVPEIGNTKYVFFTKNNVLFLASFDDTTQGNTEFGDFVSGLKFN